MSVVVVVDPGLLATVQDLGRPGFGPMGVSACGAADPIALRAGNRLLGNPDGAPAIETTLTGAAFRFPEGATVALTGCACHASIPLWQAVDLPSVSDLHIGPAISGARCYLCVRGGIDVPRVLGSASTHLPSGIGGGALKPGEILPVGPPPAQPARIRVRRSALERLAPRHTLRVTLGPQRDRFRHRLSAQYEVTAQSNRTGVRLHGAPMISDIEGSMTTEGVSLGAVQVPASGQPILLFVDAQTTGGYPIIANVIAADLPSIGQLRPRDLVRFEWTTIPEARRLYLEQQTFLQSDELLW